MNCAVANKLLMKTAFGRFFVDWKATASKHPSTLLAHIRVAMIHAFVGHAASQQQDADKPDRRALWKPKSCIEVA